jgi:hypothetical protein
LTTKVGHRVNIKLNNEEQPFLDWAERCKTWEEVVECAEAIYEWSKENETRSQQENQTFYVPKDFEDDEEGDEEFEDGEGMQWEELEGDTDGEGKASEKDDGLPDEEDGEFGSEGDEESKEDGSDGDADGEEDEKEGEKPQHGFGGQQGGEFQGDYDDDEGAREACTEHFAHNNEEDYLEEAPILKAHINLKKRFDEIDIDEIRVSYKNVLADFRHFFVKGDHYRKTDDLGRGLKLAKHTAKKITDKNKKLIMHMAKEFEMRQTAMRSIKAYQGKTGELDMNMLAKYQIVDDIFKRAIYIPDGKNHGINILLDWSGSIYRQVNDLLEQSIILAEFCRKVQIPYRVYLFTDAYRKLNHENMKTISDGLKHNSGYIVEILSNEMKNKEHTEMMWYLGSIWNGQLSNGHRYWNKVVEAWNTWFEGCEHITEHWDIQGMERMHPQGFGLGGTPLNHALVVMRKFLPEFNKMYGIEKSILTVITDGYSHSTNLTDLTDEEQAENDEQRKFLDAEGVDSWNIRDQRNIIDPYNRRVYPFTSPSRYSYNDFANTQNLLDWISKTCNVNVTGYFCLERKSDCYSLLNNIRDGIKDRPWFDLEGIWKDARKTGAVIECHGYSKLFITTPKVLRVEGEDELDEKYEGAKKTSLIAAFKRNQKSKTTSRFLTNEFIKEIA